jgi:hypothetical protein
MVAEATIQEPSSLREHLHDAVVRVGIFEPGLAALAVGRQAVVRLLDRWQNGSAHLDCRAAIAAVAAVASLSFVEQGLLVQMARSTALGEPVSDQKPVLAEEGQANNSTTCVVSDFDPLLMGPGATSEHCLGHPKIQSTIHSQSHSQSRISLQQHLLHR